MFWFICFKVCEKCICVMIEGYVIILEDMVWGMLFEFKMLIMYYFFKWFFRLIILKMVFEKFNVLFYIVEYIFECRC